MIINSEPLSMAESLAYLREEETETEVVGFMKKFTKLSEKDAKSLRKEIEGFGNIKIKQEYLVKMIDLLPESSEELNKIFVDVSLDEDETKKIIESIKKFK